MTSRPDPATVIAPDLFVRPHRVGSALVLIKGGRTFELDGVGELVWQRLDDRATLAEVAASIAAEFADADPAEVADDVVEFAATLVAHGLVEFDAP